MHYFGGEVEFIYIPVCNKDDRYIFPCYKDDKGKHKHLITISMFNHIPHWPCFINKTCECP